MSDPYLVVHTPGAFGNFIAHLIDWHQSNKLLPLPFVPSGASHNRHGHTQSLDMVIPGMWEKYNNSSNGKKVIGCVWKQDFFTYILHAYYSRTNVGQYGECGLEYAEKNFHDFVQKHTATERMKQNITDLKDLFELLVDEKNTQVPRYILRMFFWFTILKNADNIVSLTNSKIKNLKGIQLLDIEDIIDYTKLKSFFQKELAVDLDFSNLHTEFLQKNISLNEYIRANSIISAVKNNQFVDTQGLSTVSEAWILYELEKYYFDIPFFNLTNFFKNTKEIIEYIKHFPTFMKQPNKIYHQYYKMFPDPKKTKIL